MCLIIVSKPNSPKVSEEILKTSFDLNQDGIGISYSLNHELFTKKDFIGFVDFYEYFPRTNLKKAFPDQIKRTFFLNT